MALSIGHNVAGLRAQRAFQSGSHQLSLVLERLSSGRRINRASDDSAGLAVSLSLNGDGRVFSRAVANVNDGLSALNVADGAIEQLTGIVTRIRELATQAANGTFSPSQRGAINEEAQALKREFARVARSTEFNNINLLDGSVDAIAVQAGYGDSGQIASGLGGNLPDGTFGAGASAGLQNCYNIDVGDINGDGYLDFAGAGGGGGVGRVSIALGQGDGTFRAPVSYSQTYYNYAVVLADVNSDDRLDILAAGSNGSGQGNVAVRLGDGAGGFGGATLYNMDNDSSGDLACGDINGDGKADVITSGLNGSNSVTIRLGNGDGTFQASYSYNVGASSGDGCELADLDGDNDLDIVVSGWYVGVLRNNGDGTFAGVVTYGGVGSQDEDVKVGDVNGDGRLDLVSCGYSGGSGYAAVLLGNGNGTFTAGRTYETESTGSNGIALGDFNGDGIPDFATAGLNDDSTGWMNVRLGNGDGTFGERVSYYSRNQESWDIAAADMNGDGALDLGAANFFNGDLTIRLGNTGPGIALLAEFDLTTTVNAKQSFMMLDDQREQLIEQRGLIGAFQSRLAAAVGVLSVSRENYQAANGRILDTDVALESSQLVKLQILQQAGTAIMAQANEQPALALQLLASL